MHLELKQNAKHTPDAHLHRLRHVSVHYDSVRWARTAMAMAQEKQSFPQGSPQHLSQSYHFLGPGAASVSSWYRVAIASTVVWYAEEVHDFLHDHDA